MTSGNSRSKVSSRKASQMQPGKSNQVYVPNAAQVGNSLYSGIEANNLVNFYNSNLLDEMLQKNQGKYMSKSYGGNANQINPHLRKSA